jgi:PRTRC genetic system protein E
LVEDDQVRVNVMPKKLPDSENTALTTPMSFTGTATELDEQLPAAISSFVASHLRLKNTLTRAKEEMDAADHIFSHMSAYMEAVSQRTPL